MYNNKNLIPKSQRPKNFKYYEHYVHTIDKSERKWNSDYLQVTSVDPALKNFGIRIEQWNYKTKIITPLMFQRINLIEHLKNTEDEDDYNEAFVKLLEIFKPIENIIKNTNIFIIERQLPVNYKPVRISQHVITYFMSTTYNNEILPSIYEVDPKLKGEILGAGKLSETALKDWAIDKAAEILTQRNDTVSLDILNNNRKKGKSGTKADDLADTIVQVVALFLYIYNCRNKATTKKSNIEDIDEYLYDKINKFLNIKIDIDDPLMNNNTHKISIKNNQTLKEFMKEEETPKIKIKTNN